MKVAFLATFACAISSAISAPQSISDSQSLAVRDSPLSSFQIFEKRKGGGGGRSGGGSTGTGSTGSGASGAGAGARGGSGYSGYSFSPSSNAGGRTRDGSGTPKAYGNQYTGGATVPYKSGNPSPTRGIGPYALPIAAVGFFPGVWLFPVWAYGYPYGYHWYGNGRNQTSNVTCLCQQYSVCGCDPTDNSTFLATVLTNGSTSGPPVNTTMVRTVDWGNGTIASYINGTLDNGTTADGGTDPSDEDEADSDASPAVKLMVNSAGYWIMIATVVATVTIL